MKHCEDPFLKSKTQNDIPYTDLYILNYLYENEDFKIWDKEKVASFVFNHRCCTDVVFHVLENHPLVIKLNQLPEKNSCQSFRFDKYLFTYRPQSKNHANKEIIKYNFNFWNVL